MLTKPQKRVQIDQAPVDKRKVWDRILLLATFQDGVHIRIHIIRENDDDEMAFTGDISETIYGPCVEVNDNIVLALNDPHTRIICRLAHDPDTSRSENATFVVTLLID